MALHVQTPTLLLCGLSWEVTVTGMGSPFLSSLFLPQLQILIYVWEPNDVYARNLISCQHVSSCSQPERSPATNYSTLSSNSPQGVWAGPHLKFIVAMGKIQKPAELKWTRSRMLTLGPLSLLFTAGSWEKDFFFPFSLSLFRFVFCVLSFPPKVSFTIRVNLHHNRCHVIAISQLIMSYQTLYLLFDGQSSLRLTSKYTNIPHHIQFGNTVVCLPQQLTSGTKAVTQHKGCDTTQRLVLLQPPAGSPKNQPSLTSLTLVSPTSWCLEHIPFLPQWLTARIPDSLSLC